MRLKILGTLIISAASIVLGMAAPAATTPPNPQYGHRVDLNGKTFWTDDEGATSTGAVPVDADKGFVPAAHGRSFGPVMTVPNCVQPPAQSAVHDHAKFSKAELDLYGLPERLNGQSLEEWQNIVRHAGKRGCSAHNSYFDGRPTRNGQAWGHTMTPTKPMRPMAPITPKGIGAGYSEVFMTKPYGQAGWVVHESDYIETEVVAYWHFPTISLSPTLYLETMSAWDSVGDDSIYPGCQNFP